MPGQTYTYLGHSKLGYMDYVNAGDDPDLGGRMLRAVPGESYQIRAVNHGAPVPPDDGRWDPPYVRPKPPPPEPGEDGEDEKTAPAKAAAKGTVITGIPGKTAGGEK